MDLSGITDVSAILRLCIFLLDKELDNCPGFEFTGVRATERSTVARLPWREY